MKQDQNKHLIEIQKCKQDFYHFLNYLKIINKDGKRVKFVPNASQQEIYKNIFTNNWVYILKSRQIGNTTAVSAYYLWKVLFTPNFRVGVLAHNREASQNIFRIYMTMFNNLPAFLKFKHDASNANELRLFHGGQFKVSSAGSKALQGSTLNAIHASELSEYADLDETIASIFQTVGGADSQIIIETTANGLNAAYKLWINTQSGFKNVFLPWTNHEEYAQQGSVKYKIGELNEWEQRYATQYELTPVQASWVHETIATKCASSVNTFNEMYPISAEVAFITSGTKFFHQRYAGGDVASSKDAHGTFKYADPEKYKRYLMGVDTAAGNIAGDYSAISIIDITDKLNMKQVLTFRERIEVFAFARITLAIAQSYNALVVVENNSLGIAIANYLRDKNYPWLYRDTTFSKITNQFLETLGFTTSSRTRPMMLSRLQEHISRGILPVICPVLKNEMNSFIFKENTSRPEADNGAHDDLIFATALALMGIDQAPSYEQDVKLMTRPANNIEVADWERRNGMLYEDAKDADFWDDAISNPLDKEISMSTLISLTQ